MHGHDNNKQNFSDIKLEDMNKQIIKKLFYGVYLHFFINKEVGANLLMLLYYIHIHCRIKLFQKNNNACTFS